MTVRHHKVLEWESRLKAVFDRIDAALELKYADRFPLHPARAKRGMTANPEDDGLFDLGAAFSAGYGSRHGHGYTVQIRLATLQHVPSDLVQTIETEVVAHLREELPRVFPGKDLRVERDGHAFRIIGDLSLGSV
jgi:hypothetical protein